MFSRVQLLHCHVDPTLGCEAMVQMLMVEAEHQRLVRTSRNARSAVQRPCVYRLAAMSTSDI